jgi:hypothetical protein
MRDTADIFNEVRYTFKRERQEDWDRMRPYLEAQIAHHEKMADLARQSDEWDRQNNISFAQNQVAQDRHQKHQTAERLGHEDFLAKQNELARKQADNHFYASLNARGGYGGYGDGFDNPPIDFNMYDDDEKHPAWVGWQANWPDKKNRPDFRKELADFKTNRMNSRGVQVINKMFELLQQGHPNSQQILDDLRFMKRSYDENGELIYLKTKDLKGRYLQIVNDYHHNYILTDAEKKIMGEARTKKIMGEARTKEIMGEVRTMDNAIKATKIDIKNTEKQIRNLQLYISNKNLNIDASANYRKYKITDKTKDEYINETQQARKIHLTTFQGQLAKLQDKLIKQQDKQKELQANNNASNKENEMFFKKGL